MAGLIPLAVGGAAGYLAGPRLIEGVVKKKDRPLVGAAIGAGLAFILWPRLSRPYGVAQMLMPTVRQGSSGAAVTTLQRNLAAYFNIDSPTWKLGNPVPTDWETYYHEGSGTFGVSTIASLQAFQRREGLTVDGIAGPNTWAKLGYGSSTRRPSSSAPAPTSQAPATQPAGGSPAQHEAEDKEKRKKILLYSGVGGGAVILFIIILMATK